ncbi:MAG TPA: hypothetical protein VFW96_03070 [Thermomicrobiales bacterium]|nr:hypothetical protein [Thermomicrobiales bacterium]
MQTQYGSLTARRRQRRTHRASAVTTLAYGTLSIAYGCAFYAAVAIAWLRERAARWRRARTAPRA